MTPDDVAAIRAWWRPMWHMGERRVHVLALCDALETAWASRGDMIKIALASLSDYREMRERAERAEADYSDLENQFRLHRELCAGRLESLKRTQAALARVRRIIDDCDGSEYNETVHAIDGAIDGP